MVNSKNAMIYEHTIELDQNYHLLSMPEGAIILGAQPCQGNNLRIALWVVAHDCKELVNRPICVFKNNERIPDGNFTYIATVQVPHLGAFHIVESLP